MKNLTITSLKALVKEEHSQRFRVTGKGAFEITPAYGTALLEHIGGDKDHVVFTSVRGFIKTAQSITGMANYRLGILTY